MKRIVPYILAIVIILVFYSLFSDRLDRETVAQLENIFNEQQAVQVSLASHSLEDYFNDDILPELQILSSYGLNPVIYGSWVEHFSEQNPGRAPNFSYTDQFVAVISYSADGTSETTIIQHELDPLALRSAVKQWMPFISEVKRTEEYFIPHIVASPERQLFAVILPKYSFIGRFSSVDVIVMDLFPLMQRYIAPIRSGLYGAAWVLDQDGVVIFDHETEIIGQNVSNLHENYPELIEFDRRLLTEESGLGEYSFTVERGGEVNRKIGAWATVHIEGISLKVAMSAPDTEISMQLRETEYLETGIAIGLTILLIAAGAFLYYHNQRELQQQVRQRTSELSQQQDHLKTALAEKESTTTALLESENRFRQLAENINEVFFVYDVIPQEMVYVSPAFTRIFELPQEKAFQYPMQLLRRVYHEDWKLVRSGFKSLYRYKVPVELLLRMHVGSEIRWMRVRSVPLVQNTVVYRLIGTVEDVTLRKAYEEHAMDLQIERERIQILSQFIQDASHEFKTPLSLINTAIYIMGKTDLSKTARSRLESVHQQVNKIQHLVDRLVLMSRIDASRELTLRPVDLNTLIMQLPENLSRRMREAKIQFEYDLETGMPLIQADSVELHRAFVELIDNAVQHTPQNGQITVSTSCTEHSVVLEIHDTGDGIPEEEQATIFQRFYRVDKAHTTAGMGLGLSIAKAIVELHHGSISIISHEGSGSIFTIKLPAASTLEATVPRRQQGLLTRE